MEDKHPLPLQPLVGFAKGAPFQFINTVNQNVLLSGSSFYLQLFNRLGACFYSQGAQKKLNEDGTLTLFVDVPAAHTAGFPFSFHWAFIQDENDFPLAMGNAEQIWGGDPASMGIGIKGVDLPDECADPNRAAQVAASFNAAQGFTIKETIGGE